MVILLPFLFELLNIQALPLCPSIPCKRTEYIPLWALPVPSKRRRQSLSRWFVQIPSSIHSQGPLDFFFLSQTWFSEREFVREMWFRNRHRPSFGRKLARHRQ